MFAADFEKAFDSIEHTFFLFSVLKSYGFGPDFIQWVKTLFNNAESCVRLQLHGAIYRSDSFVFMLRYCANLKAIRYDSTSFNRIVADKSHRVIAA